MIKHADIIYSFGWLLESFVHKQFIRQYQIQQLYREKLFNWFNPICHIILFNFAMADWILDSPIFVKNYENQNITNLNEEIIWNKSHDINICFNKVKFFFIKKFLFFF